MKNNILFKSFLFLFILSSCSNNTPYIGDNGNWYVKGEDAGIQAEGKDGQTPNIVIGSNGNWFINGIDTNICATGDKGETGNGILNISLTSSNGEIDTYTITYTNGTSDTFNVINGIDGVTPLFKVENNCLLVSYDNGEYYKNLGNIKGITGEKGEDGITPNININQETNEWEVSYDNGNTWTSLGIKATGKDGQNSTVTIGNNGNWFINGIDSEVSALGIQGQTGNGIKDIIVTYEVDENKNEYNVFTFTFTDETIEPLVQKVLLPTKIVDGGELITNNFIALKYGEQTYDLEVCVKYSNGSYGSIVLEEENIINNDIDFYNNGRYTLTYEFLNETFNYDIYVLNEQLYNYKQTIIGEVKANVNSYYYIDDALKKTYEDVIEELNCAYTELTINKLYAKYLTIKNEILTVNSIVAPFNVAATTELYFFDSSDPSEIQEKSVIEYKGQYTPSIGCYYTWNGEAFDVLSCSDGIVTEVKVDPLFGRMIYISKDDMTYCYGSLQNIRVQVGDEVSSGQIIANASVCTLLSSYNNGLYIAIYQGTTSINPRDVYDTEISIDFSANKLNKHQIFEGYVIEPSVNNDSGFYLYTNNGTIFVYDNGKANVSHGDKISLNGIYTSYNIGGKIFYEIDITQYGSYIKMIKNSNSVLPISNVMELDLKQTSSFQTTTKTSEELMSIYHTSAYLLGSENGAYRLCDSADGNGNNIYWYQSSININYYSDTYGCFDISNPLHHIENSIVNDGTLYDFYFIINCQNTTDGSYEIVPLFYN